MGVGLSVPKVVWTGVASICFHEAWDVFGSLGIAKVPLRYDYLKELPLQLSSLREVAYEIFLPFANELLQQHCLEACDAW